MKKPTVIVEGPDNSGKSTLAAKLHEALGLPVIHSPVGRGIDPGDREAMIALGKTYVQFTQNLDGCILDRICLISDRVFGPILRDSSAFDDEALDGLWRDMVYRVKPLVVVYCRPSWQTLSSTIGDRAQFPGVVEKFEAVVKQYDQVMLQLANSRTRGGTFDFPVLVYNYPEDPASTELASGINLLTGLERRGRFEDYIPVNHFDNHIVKELAERGELD